MTPDPGPEAFRRALHQLYDELDAALTRLGPVCALSGRCCRFAEYGHTLFLSAPELETLLAEAPAPAGPLDDGATCPWQDARGHCTARAGRPLGCRVYYCDPAYRQAGEALAESYIGRLKRLVEAYGLPWSYAPLHAHLRAARDDGRFPPGHPAPA